MRIPLKPRAIGFLNSYCLHFYSWKPFYEKTIFLFSFIVLVSCNNTENTINTSTGTQVTPIIEDISIGTDETNFNIVTSNKPLDDFSKNLSKDKVILHLSLPTPDIKHNPSTFYHFFTLKDFYDFIHTYTEKLANWPNFQYEKNVKISLSEVFLENPEIKTLYNEFSK